MRHHSCDGASIGPTPRLAVRIQDTRRGTTVVRWFFRSPVTVGRADWNTLCLDARGVADYHGAFVFVPPGHPQFLDLQPRGGTLIDGVPTPPDGTMEIDETSVIVIGPFRITVC